MHEPDSCDVLEFGHFQFNSRTLELHERGSLRRLQPQPAKVLRRLIEAGGGLVSREELCQAVWGEQTFVDFDQGLNFCIKQIRAVLHDDSDRPIYVETVPRRGYRFIAPVTREARVSSPAPPAPAPAARPAFGARRVVAAVALAAVAAAAVYVGLKAIVQREIGRAVSDAVEGSTGTAISSAPPGDDDTRQLYVKGRFFWNQRRPDSLAKAREYFEQALARDPAFAPAYAGLGDIEFSRGGPGAPAALALAEKALALDPSLGEAHVTAGHAAMHAFNWSIARSRLQRAIQLDPSSVPARYIYAEYLVATGQFEVAIAEARRGVALDPASAIANHALGTICYYARRFDEAARQFRQALELDPGHHWSYSRLGQVYEQQARWDDAVREFAAGGFSYGTARVNARAGRPQEARQMVQPANAPGSPYELAVLLAGLGELDPALDALERAATLPSYDAVYLAVDPKLDRLRSSSRFDKLLERVGLPPVPPEVTQLSPR
jgi:DNA-binding winged helix-turn-helix (wHTH) protein/Tfp pilus assembly protein PilF